MAIIELDDKLIEQVINIGHYQTAQKAIDSILADYIEMHQKQNTAFDKLCVELNLTDKEIENLFKRDSDNTGSALDL